MKDYLYKIKDNDSNLYLTKTSKLHPIGNNFESYNSAMSFARSIKDLDFTIKTFKLVEV